MQFDYPIDAQTVDTFLRNSEYRFVDALKLVLEKINKDRENYAHLSCIYNVYSRSDKQRGSELKEPRKIRAKMNNYCADNNLDFYKPFDMPDIVALTITVPFPSDVNVVSAHFDELIDGRAFFAVYAKGSVNPFVKTKYGSDKSQDGYYACHYCLRKRDDALEPIVEVQIKTLLHDAWGVKNHDLTYKNSTFVDSSTRIQFNELGDALAKLDSLSNRLRDKIIRDSAAGELKKQRVLDRFLKATMNQRGFIIEQKELLDEIYQIKTERESDQFRLSHVKAIRDRCISHFQADPRQSCVLLLHLAMASQMSQIKLTAMERIDMWRMYGNTAVNQIESAVFLHFTQFMFGDTLLAIDAAEEALEINLTAKQEYPDPKTYFRYQMALSTSLSYYHAEILDTHYGSRSKEKSLRYVSDTYDAMRSLGYINDDIEQNPVDAIISLLDKKPSDTICNVIENTLFVTIMTAEDARPIRTALRRLYDLRALFAKDDKEFAQLRFDLHEHHARKKIFDIETDEAFEQTHLTSW